VRIKTMAKRTRAKVLQGKTHEIITGCGSLFITLNEDKEGLFEIFIKLGKGGGCAASQNEAIGRSISAALRYGAPPSVIIKQLKGIICPYPIGNGETRVTSCADAIAITIENHLKKESEKVNE
jgi:ribonucleoside-diphosphate reductase alpha chain